MPMTIHINIVSAEEQIFSGVAEYVVASGTYGELGIWPRHAPLLTSLKPGSLRVVKKSEPLEEEVFYISGGVLEIQPHVITVLADTAARAAELDEAAALEAKERAEQAIQNRQTEFEFAEATKELAQAIAQLQAIRKLRKQVHIGK